MTRFTHFADDSHQSWDQETGMPTSTYFGNAIQVWSMAIDRPATVQEAALTFNVSPDLVRECIEDHPWMYLDAEDHIEHDGE
jgi:hypothetical protein